MTRSGVAFRRVVGLFVFVALVELPAPTGAGEPWSAWSGAPISDAVDVGDPDLAPDAFGFGTNMDFVSAEEFVCSDAAGTCDYSQCHNANYWCADSTGAEVFAAVEVPAGALVTGFRVLYYDASASYLIVNFRLGWTSLGTRGFSTLYTFVSSGSPGVDDFYLDMPDFTVERRYPVLTQWGYRSYFLSVTLPATASVQLRGIAVFWNRQISPAPATATFDDVPTDHWAFQHIEALAASGITAGCGGGSYCPDAGLTRAQMAVFLANGLGLHWRF